MKINYEMYSLKNGIQVLLIPTKDLYSVTISNNYLYGSALENEKTNGLTHLLEHLALKETRRWPQEQMDYYLDTNGASRNGGTNYEGVNYYVNIPYTKLEYGFEYISQVSLNSVFKKNSVNKEKDVIYNEIDDDLESPWNRKSLFESDYIFKNKTSYRLPIIGTKENLKRFTINDIENHYQMLNRNTYQKLSVVGNFDKAKAKKLIAGHFEDNIMRPSVTEFPEDHLNKGLYIHKKDKLTKLALFDVMFEVIPRADFRTENLYEIMHLVLNGLTTSRLQQTLRSKSGLLYSINSGALILNKFGIYSIYIECDPENIRKVAELLFKELKLFFEKGISQKELELAKEYLINRKLVRYDNFKSYSALFVDEFLNDQSIYQLEESISHIRTIKKDAINKIIADKLDIKHCTAELYGNITDKLIEDTGRIIQRYKA